MFSAPRNCVKLYHMLWNMLSNVWVFDFVFEEFLMELHFSLLRLPEKKGWCVMKNFLLNSAVGCWESTCLRHRALPEHLDLYSEMVHPRRASRKVRSFSGRTQDRRAHPIGRVVPSPPNVASQHIIAGSIVRLPNRRNPIPSIYRNLTRTTRSLRVAFWRVCPFKNQQKSFN